MPKCNFNNVAKLYDITFRHRYYPVNWLHILRRPFYKNTSEVFCNFIEITLRYGCSSVNWLHIFRTLFYENSSEGQLL